MGSVQFEDEEYFFYDPEKKKYYNEICSFPEKMFRQNYNHIELVFSEGTLSPLWGNSLEEL